MCDVILAFNAESLEKNLSSLRDGGVCFCNEKIRSKLKPETITSIEEKRINLITLEINDKYDNTYLLALFAFHFSLPQEVVNE
jgi:Pyruvate/2-oxoacid:ferredoxin oxidoreductase gamma subunit